MNIISTFVVSLCPLLSYMKCQHLQIYISSCIYYFFMTYFIINVNPPTVLQSTVTCTTHILGTSLRAHWSELFIFHHVKCHKFICLSILILYIKVFISEFKLSSLLTAVITSSKYSCPPLIILIVIIFSYSLCLCCVMFVYCCVVLCCTLLCRVVLCLNHTCRCDVTCMYVTTSVWV